mgnify:CR=1 FL=1
MNVDVVSDVHVGQWTSEKDGTAVPLFAAPTSPILVVAGNVSDDIHRTLTWLEQAASHYEHVLFVDGHREHAGVFPALFGTEYVYQETKRLCRDNVVYLPKRPFRVGDVVFVGVSGWWNYHNAREKRRYLSYFDELDEEDACACIKNVLRRSMVDYLALKRIVERYEKDPSVRRIVVVTHTVPLEQFTDEKHSTTDFNSFMPVLLRRNKKISHWVFGHTQRSCDQQVDGVRFVCHPRGRPDDAAARADYARATFRVDTSSPYK